MRPSAATIAVTRLGRATDPRWRLAGLTSPKESTDRYRSPSKLLRAAQYAETTKGQADPAPVDHRLLLVVLLVGFLGVVLGFALCVALVNFLGPLLAVVLRLRDG